jgi:hypothetical protein
MEDVVVCVLNTQFGVAFCELQNFKLSTVVVC